MIPLERIKNVTIAACVLSYIEAKHTFKHADHLNWAINSGHQHDHRKWPVLSCLHLQLLRAKRIFSRTGIQSLHRSKTVDDNSDLQLVCNVFSSYPEKCSHRKLVSANFQRIFLKHRRRNFSSGSGKSYRWRVVVAERRKKLTCNGFGSGESLTAHLQSHLVKTVKEGYAVRLQTFSF